MYFLFTEIAKVRASLFQINGVKKEPLVLPEAEGMVTTLTEKVYVPVKEHPDVSNKLISTVVALDSSVYLKHQASEVKGMKTMIKHMMHIYNHMIIISPEVYEFLVRSVEYFLLFQKIKPPNYSVAT